MATYLVVLLQFKLTLLRQGARAAMRASHFLSANKTIWIIRKNEWTFICNCTAWIRINKMHKILFIECWIKWATEIKKFENPSFNFQFECERAGVHDECSKCQICRIVWMYWCNHVTTVNGSHSNTSFNNNSDIWTIYIYSDILEKSRNDKLIKKIREISIVALNKLLTFLKNSYKLQSCSFSHLHWNSFSF